MARPDKREEIVRVALKLIAEKGFHGAPMAMIADRAGVGAGTIYNYFESKDALIMELNRDIEVRIVTFLYQGYSKQRPIRERYIHIATRLFSYFTVNSLDFMYMEQFNNSPYGIFFSKDKMLKRFDKNDICTELFNEGIAQQIIINLPNVILFNLAFGSLIALARDHILGFIELDEGLINITVSACWRALKL